MKYDGRVLEAKIGKYLLLDQLRAKLHWPSQKRRLFGASAAWPMARPFDDQLGASVPELCTKTQLQAKLVKKEGQARPLPWLSSSRSDSQPHFPKAKRFA